MTTNEETQEHNNAATETGPDFEALKQALAEQKQKADAYLANWQRAGADLANYKRKVEQDKQEQSAFANASLISSVLPILDDMERAFETLDPKLAGLTWVNGMRLISRKLQAILEAQGLQRITTVGLDFDPKLHEAVMEVEGEQGKVVSEMQKGYKLHDRVLRPAIVTVGRGGPEKPGL